MTAKPRLVALGVLVVYFLLCFGAQGLSGSWCTPFGTYPDEPSHFVGGVMLRDYIASGLRTDPLPFAREYYARYPFFAVGYWPPLFYILEGIWFLVAGVGKMQALFAIAAAAAGTAWLIYLFARRHASHGVAFCAGLVLLTLPDTLRMLNAVMLDLPLSFFCLAAAGCLIRYFDAPGLREGMLFAFAATCAILTKYSALYISILPLMGVTCLRRFDLLRRSSFLIQPLTIAAFVGPWAIWTIQLAFHGLPSQRIGTTMGRLTTAAREVFEVFPTGPRAGIIAGLLVLLVMRRAWQPDLALLALFSVSHLAWLTASPVELEGRYVLAASAALLVLAAAGWGVAATALHRHGAVWASAVPAALGLLCVFEMTTTLPAREGPSDYSIRAVVRTIASNPAWNGSRVLVAPDLEGPMIAEFAIQDRHRPGYILKRPGKLFASMNWFGGEYMCRFRSSADLMASLRREPVDLVVWHENPGTTLRPHERLLRESLSQNPESWRRLAEFASGNRKDQSFEVYEYVP